MISAAKAYSRTVARRVRCLRLDFYEFPTDRISGAVMEGVKTPVEIEIATSGGSRGDRAAIGRVLLEVGVPIRFAEAVDVTIDPDAAAVANVSWWLLTYGTEDGDDIGGAAAVGQAPAGGLRRVLPVAGVWENPADGARSVRQIEALMLATEGRAALRVVRKGREIYDSGIVAAGALISTGVLELAGVEALSFVVNNAGAAARNLTRTRYREDGATVVLNGQVIRSVASVSTEVGLVSIGAAVTGGSTSFAVNDTPGPKEKFELVAGGAGNGRLTIFGR